MEEVQQKRFEEFHEEYGEDAWEMMDPHVVLSTRSFWKTDEQNDDEKEIEERGTN